MSFKHSRKTEDGYTLIAEEFPADGTEDAQGKALKDKADAASQNSHDWVLLLHGYTGWKEEMYPFAYGNAGRPNHSFIFSPNIA